MLAIYCRISVDRPNQKSIKEQQEQGSEFAKTLGLPYEFYVDVGISGGGKIEDRPEFERLIFDIDTDKVSGLWVWNADRTQREEIIWFKLADLLIKKNIDFYEDGKKIDLNDPNTFFLYGIKSQMDAMYKRVTSKKIKAVLKRNASEGKTKGILPYGYKSDQNNLMQIDEEEASTVKLIYKLSLEGIGTNKIAEILNEEGIPTRYNKIGKGTIKVKNKATQIIKTIAKKDIKWSGNTIRGIIVNPIYKGVRVFSGTVYTCPNIFDDVYWERVNKNLSKNRNNSGKKVEHKYLLKGLLRCGRCGRNYYGRVNKRDSFYMCSSKRIKSDNCGNRGLSIAILEDLIWTKFIADGKLSKLIENHFNNKDKKDNLKAIENDIKTREKRLVAIKKDREKLIDLVLEEAFTSEQLKPRNKKLEVEEEDIKIELSHLKEQLKQYSNIENNIAGILGELDNINTQINHNDKREILTKHISNIAIHYDDEETYFIQIEFKNITMDSFVYALPKHYNYAYTLEFGAEINTEMVLLERLTGDRRESSTEYDINIMVNANDVYQDLILKYKN